jgi:hypothetical protein
LNPIENAGGGGFYTVNWPATELAQTYSLEEDGDPAFSSPTEVYTGTERMWSVPAPGKTAETYFYRLRGRNTWGYGAYSNVEAVTVRLPDVPVLNPIDNADGNSTYTVTWNLSARATGYALQEDRQSDFSSATTIYAGAETSWLVTGRAPGTYYYRVLATSSVGQSGWSNVQSAAVWPFRADHANLTAGECTTLRWDFTGIRSLFISFGYGYDKEGVTGQGSRQVCPSVTTTYEALVVNQDWSQVVHRVTVEVSGSGCADPVIQRFSPTTYEVSPGQPFSIFWDVDCAATVWFIQVGTSEEPVGGHDSRIDVRIYADTDFQLRVERTGGGFVFASFTVSVR